MSDQFNFQDHTIRETIELSIVTKELSPETQEAYESFISNCEKWFPSNHLPNSHLEIYSWLKSLRESGLSDTTIHTYFKKMKAVMRSLHKHYDAPFFIDRVDTPKVRPKDRRFFTNDEIYRIIKACKTDFERALILTLIDSGCRIGEISTITTDKIDVEKGIIQHYGKGDQYYTHRLDPDVCRGLILICPPTTKYVFSLKGIDTPYQSPECRKNTKNLGHQVTRIMKRAGLTGEKLAPHTIRHTTITALAKEYGKERIVMEFTGHKSEKSVAGYIHSIDKVETITAFSPLNDIVKKSDLAKDERETSESPQYQQIELASGETVEVEYLPALTTDTKKEALTKERLDYYYNLERNIPELDENQSIRPKLSKTDFHIIKECIFLALKANVLGIYSGEAIALLNRMTRKVK